jgi:hypothetical protein
MKFFVPAATSPAQAEEVYATFVRACVKTYPLKSAARLYSISFLDRGRSGVVAQACTAQVGDELIGWRREPVGPVLAIIETAGLVQIFTKHRGGLSDGPLLVSPGEVTERVYFDDCTPTAS